MKIHEKTCAGCGGIFRVDAQHARKKCCSDECVQKSRAIERYGTKQEQFWAKVNKTDSCWEWTGTIMRGGYGHFSINNRYKQAHRVSYQMNVGAIPAGLCVLHRCDNRRCVRPDHLFLGTQKDNAQDAIAKGRFTTGERNGFRKKKEAHKLTDTQVNEIAQRYKRGGITHKELAAEYGVSKSLVTMIIGNRRRTLGRL